MRNSLAVLAAFEQFPTLVEDLKNAAADFASSGIMRLLRSAPEVEDLVNSVKEMFYEEEGTSSHLVRLRTCPDEKLYRRA